jgi:hypothetical protein
MNRYYPTLFILIICLTSCFSLLSQTENRIGQIKNHCDSIDILTDIQTIRKIGAGVILDFIISNEKIVKIIEQPSGYKNVSAKITYYLQYNIAVFIIADIETSSEEGDELTIELHKIYLNDKGTIGQFTSKRTFNADSLYSDNSDPINTAFDIRKNARFKPKEIDPGFEKTLLNTIYNYLNAAYRKDGDPIFNQLYSPFI